MKRSIGCKQLLLGLTLALAVTGCANGKANPDPGGQRNAQGGSNAGTPAPRQLQVKTYFADENLDKLIERETTITYASDAEKYKAALEALKTAPEASLSPLSKGITFKSAVFRNGHVVVDLSIADNGRLGAPGEQLLVDSIRKSMFQFGEVQTVDLLVDGKQTESLMGHVSLTHPYKRNERIGQ